MGEARDGHDRRPDGGGDGRGAVGVRWRDLAAGQGAASVVCGLALVMSQLRTWVLNYAIFPVTSAVCPLAREFQTLVHPLLGLVIILLVLRRPSALRPRPALVASVAGTLAGLLILGLWSADPILVAVGHVLRSAGGVLVFYFVGIALAVVTPERTSVVTVACSMLVSQLLITLLPVPGYVVALVLSVILGIVPYVLLWRYVRPTLGLVEHSRVVTDLAVANPRSYLAPFHQVFVLIFIFSGSYGLALSFNDDQHTPMSTVLPLVVLALITAWLFIANHKKGRPEDGLFAVAAVFMMGGLLATIAVPHVPEFLPNGLLGAGSAGFSVLLWVSLAALCRRNPVGSVYVLACGSIAQSLGLLAGADSGHAFNGLVGTHPGIASHVTLVVALAVFAYVLVGLRGFTFEQTILGVVPAREIQATEMAPSREELIERACVRLAGEHGVTDREREVMRLLTYGYSGKRIQDMLTVSYNTVKSHARHIYRKLGVHSQQELIDLVEQAAFDGGESPGVAQGEAQGELRQVAMEAPSVGRGHSALDSVPYSTVL